MLLTLCDGCGTLIDEEWMRHLEKQEGEQILCPRCSSSTQIHEEFICDRCHTSLSVDTIRDGQSVVIPKTEKSQGMILCKRCGMVKRTKTDAKHLRYVMEIFIICLAIPLVTGLILYIPGIKDRRSESRDVSRDLYTLQRDIQAMARELRNLNFSKKEELPSNIPSKPVKSSSNDSASQEQIATSKTSFEKERSKSEQSPLLSDNLIDSICHKAIASHIEKLKKGNTREKLESLLYIARTRQYAAEPFVVELLQDRDPVVRSFSAKTLGMLGSHSSVGKLMITLGDTEAFVRKSGASVLSNLTGDKFIYVEDMSQEKWQKLQQFRERQLKKKEQE